MNKRVLITGSSKGIGKAIAEKFHSQGWDVGITARGQAEISELTNLLNGKRLNSAIGIKADLSSSDEIKFLRQMLEREWEKLDCIIFNIGTGQGTKGLAASAEENEKSLRTNFSDVVKTFRWLLPLVNKEIGASLIFIGSIAQEVNVKAPISYSYAKRALNNFVIAQSLELAPHKILVNLINPGHILTKNGVWDTKMKNTPDEFNEFVSKNVPLGRVGQVGEVADLVFLTSTSEFSNYLTGSRINIDGGTSLTS
jgi:3-oxoacyl-[acyl-carrier protein] reductase